MLSPAIFCLLAVSNLADSAVLRKYFDQDIDHNGLKNGTFKQLYYESLSEEPESRNDLKFLYVGGQATLSIGSVSMNFMSELADKYLADKYALEHRFYGTSQPSNDLSTENLQYLSVEQAIEDIKDFIVFINGKDQNRWILFGYGYGGNLAVWARSKYPDLIFGAVASGAPVQAQMNIQEFLPDVAQIMRTSPKCVETVKSGMAQMVKMFGNDIKRTKLKESLNLCEAPAGQFDKFSLASYIADAFSEVSVYNVKDSSGNSRVSSICENLKKQEGDDLTKLGPFLSHFYGSPKCLNFSYKINPVFNEKLDFYDFSRQIYYQKCSQLGMFATTGSNNQPFAHALPLMYFTKICVDAFGQNFNQKNIEKYVKMTNENFKGNSLDGIENVLIINGENDPWKKLGISKFTDVKFSKVIELKGGYHLEDEKMTLSNDSKDLKSLRSEISNMIEKWISQS